MDSFVTEFWNGLPNSAELGKILFRLIAAMILGGAIGLQREHARKPAGLRTHMLVAMGAALYVMAGQEAGMATNELSRIVQGIATGIGFIGGGVILQLAATKEIKGITTAAGIWATAAVGVAVGLGKWGFAAIGVLMTLLVLAVVVKFEVHSDEYN